VNDRRRRMSRRQAAVRAIGFFVFAMFCALYLGFRFIPPLRQALNVADSVLDLSFYTAELVVFGVAGFTSPSQSGAWVGVRLVFAALVGAGITLIVLLLTGQLAGLPGALPLLMSFAAVVAAGGQAIVFVRDRAD